MADFKLTKGQRYQATLTLGWLESFAGNDLISGELERAGFGNVVVTGEGETRVAEGVWIGESTDVSLPHQVTDVRAV